jgi:Zinc-binding dehydrogenase
MDGSLARSAAEHDQLKDMAQRQVDERPTPRPSATKAAERRHTVALVKPHTVVSVAFEMASYLKGLMDSGAFRPVIDRRYRLDQIVEAYTYFKTGQKLGNVVISVEPSTS